MEGSLIVGIIAGSLTSISALPQIIKAIKTREAGDVSVFMFLILITGVSLWMVYGFMKQDMPIIITNGVSVVLNGLMLILKYKYSKK